MATSILTSVKSGVGVVESDISFDADITLYINGVFATLKQLGIGPDAGFAITDKTATWESYLGEDLLLYNNVLPYMILKVRLLFDPPSTSFVIAAFEKQILEMEWRINTAREEATWVPPVIIVDSSLL